MKFKSYKGGSLRGTYSVSVKLDGVRVEYKEGQPFSRQGKPLYNLPIGLEGTYECFLGTFKITIEKVRTQKKLPTITGDYLFQLHPILDKRLVISEVLEDPTEQEILDIVEPIWNEGGEGIILYNVETGIRHKVKKYHTLDVKVLDWIEGTGKYKGMLGALMTEKGKVGTGFIDADRKRITKEIVGKTIECKCMEITEGGKMRMPVFVRERPDKD